MKTTVLVAGGAGYIGSHMVKALIATGHRVITLDNLSTGCLAAVPGGAFVRGDLGDADLLDRLFRSQSIDAVMHFAALSQIGESVTRPARYYRNNVAATLTLLDAAREHGVHGVVFSSTAAVYGEPVRAVMDEQHPLEPINPYGRTKLMIEHALADYDTAYGLRSIVLRYFNAAGADPEGELGERHDPETHLVPLVLQAASGRRPHVTVFGRDYDTADGTCVRDYVHVSDLCAAHLLALRRILAGGDSATYNLGNGRGHSVQEVVDTVRRVSGEQFEVRDGARRPGDPARLVADSSRARRELGWRPRHEVLETMVRHAWAWEQRCRDGERAATSTRTRPASAGRQRLGAALAR